MKKTILITGANGFLGSYFLSFLGEKKDIKIYGVSLSFKNQPRSNLFACDLLRPKEFQSVLQRIKPSYIFHFAGGRYVNDQQTFDANFLTTKNLFESIKVLGLGRKTRVIIPGSAAEYGNIETKNKIVENCLPKPMGWYGFVKLLQTQLGVFYAQQDFDVVIVRMFNVSGACSPISLALGGFAKQIVDIENGADPVIKTKNLDGQRDFLDVKDVCRGLWAVALKGKSGQIYNLCSGRSSTIRDLLQQLLQYSTFKGIKIKENKDRASLSFDVIGSNKKIRLATQWASQVSLQQSLKNTLESYRKMSRN